MGEFELLARVREMLPGGGPRLILGSGDDAAITVPGGATATSIDTVVDGVHFHRDQAGPRRIGFKAVTAALSDLAAMGAEAGEVYAAVGLPADIGESECLELVEGMVAAAGESGAALAGGDLTRSPVLTVTVTVVGHAESAERLVTRGGGRAGDIVAVTGDLGGAAAGLLLLDRPGLGDGIDGPTRDALLGRQLEPRPRIAAGLALRECGATAMIDLSDGLGGDAAHLAAAGGVAIEIDGGAVPLAGGVAAVAAAAGIAEPLELGVGGEDYELLAALPEAALTPAREAVAGTGAALTPIGRIRDGEGVEIRLPGGGLLAPAGFDQLR